MSVNRTFPDWRKVFPWVLETEMIFEWSIQRSDSGGSGMRTRSRDFVRNPRCAVCSVIRTHASSPLYGAQKNALWRLRSSAHGLVRPTHAPNARSVSRRCAHLPRTRGAARPVQELRQSEARAPGVSRRQSVLYQALCALRWPTLPVVHDQGSRQRAPSGLGHGQDTEEYMVAQLAKAGARTQGDRYRRNLDQEGPYLAHRGERLDPRPPDLVWRRGSLGEKHGPVLRLARREEKWRRSPGDDGLVEAVSQRDPRTRAESGDPARQVPHRARPGRGARQGSKERICAPSGQGSALHQRPEIHAALAPGEPHAGRQTLAQASARSKQEAEHRLPAQGVLRAVLELPGRGLGAAILRELARKLEVAAPCALREVRQDYRAPLGWNRRLLQAGEQGLSGLRRRVEQQDSRHPTARLSAARRGIICDERS